jgi:hypothetical protein
MFSMQNVGCPATDNEGSDRGAWDVLLMTKGGLNSGSGVKSSGGVGMG